MDDGVSSTKTSSFSSPPLRLDGEVVERKPVAVNLLEGVINLVAEEAFEKAEGGRMQEILSASLSAGILVGLLPPMDVVDVVEL